MSSLTQVHRPPSSTPSSTTATTSSSRLLKPTTLPIPVLSSTLAKRYGLAHTLAVPAYYYLRASALVSDPLPTMIADLLVVGLAQSVYCAVCLPSAGSWVSGTLGGKIIEGTATAAATTTATRTSSKNPFSAVAGGGGSLRKKGGPGGKSTSKGKSASGDGGAGAGAGGSMASRVMVSLSLSLIPEPQPFAHNLAWPHKTRKEARALDEYSVISWINQIMVY